MSLEDRNKTGSISETESASAVIPLRDIPC